MEWRVNKTEAVGTRTLVHWELVANPAPDPKTERVEALRRIYGAELIDGVFDTPEAALTALQNIVDREGRIFMVQKERLLAAQL